MESLKDCECPFNWDINEQIVFDFNEESLQFEHEMSVINLMYSIMSTYVYVIKDDYNKALKNLHCTDYIWSNFNHAIFCLESMSLNIILEIILSTKLNVLYRIKQLDEIDKLLSDIRKNKLNMRKTNSSTLNGCKAIAWSFFHEKGAENAISFARSALKDNPNCSLWHFVLGKNLRRLRRSEVWCCNPSIEELQSLAKAYELKNNPSYGIYAAQSYQENLEEEVASDYYIKIFKTRPTDCKIQLRLALCFLRSKDLHRAKICLDYVEICCPQAEMFYHYKGIYYKKINNFVLAAEYLKKASKGSNLGAYIDYGQCMLKVDKDFSYIFHLLNLLHKFRGADNKIIQQLLLHIAMEHYQNENYSKSFKYFMKGIKLSPNSNLLKNYPSRFNKHKKYNIYAFIENDLIPKLEQTTKKMSEDNLNDIKDFKHIQSRENKIVHTTTSLHHYSWSNTYQFYIIRMTLSELFYKLTSFIKCMWNFFCTFI